MANTTTVRGKRSTERTSPAKKSPTANGRTVGGKGRLIATFDDRTEFAGEVRKADAEQSGPVRAVVKIEGVHKAVAGAREWLPFTVRLYFYAGEQTVRMVHTIVFDGDEQKDFLRGLGLVFEVPMREEVHNRHVRFSGEGDGLWAEPLQPLTGRRSLRGNAYANQLAGKRVPNRAEVDPRGQELMRDWAVWDSFTFGDLASPRIGYPHRGRGRAAPHSPAGFR